MSGGFNSRRILLLVFILGVLLRLFDADVISITDEGLYVYLAKEVYLGSVPYRDFFYVHPPLYQYLTALVFRIFGVGLVQARLVPILFSILSMFLVYKMSRRFYGERHAFLSSVLFSLSPGVVCFTKYPLLNSTLVFFTIMSYYLFMEGFEINSSRKLFLSGVCIGLASLTKFLGLTTLPIFLLFLLVRRKSLKSFTPVVLGFSLIFTPFLVYFSPYVKNLLLFHALKFGYSLLEKLQIALLMITGHYLMIFWLGVVGVYLTLRDGKRSDADVLLLLAAVLNFVFFILIVNYTTPINPVLYFVYMSPAFTMLGSRIVEKLDRFLKEILVLMFITSVLLPVFIDFAYLSNERRALDSDIRSAAEYVRANTGAEDMIVATPYPLLFVAFFADRKIIGNATDLSQYRFLKDGSFDVEYFHEVTKDASYVVVISHESMRGCFDEFIEKYIFRNNQQEWRTPMDSGKYLDEHYKLEKEINNIKIYSKK